MRNGRIETEPYASVFNPRSPIKGGKSAATAKAIRSNLIAQARDYTEKFGKVVYHTNSAEFIAHYRRVFAQQGLPMDKIVFVLTP